MQTDRQMDRLQQQVGWTAQGPNLASIRRTPKERHTCSLARASSIDLRSGATNSSGF